MKNDLWSKVKWPLLALGLVFLFNLLFTTGFFHVEIKDGRLYGSIIDVFNRGTPVALLTLGMTLVIATGGVDLSVGAVMAIAGAIAALGVSKWQLGAPAAVMLALGAAGMAGIWNGSLVAWFKVPPIVATLILMVSGRGVAQLLSDGQIITFTNKGLEFIGRGVMFGLPITLTITLLAFLVLSFLKEKTGLGFLIQATGDNEIASGFAGVNTRVVKVAVYVICSLLAGVAGLIVAADIRAADSNHAGEWLELDAILATVVGGTALTGGRFSLVGSVVAAFLIQTVTTTILTRGIAVQFTLVVKAIIILVVCLLQSEKFRENFARKRVAA